MAYVGQPRVYEVDSSIMVPIVDVDLLTVRASMASMGGMEEEKVDVESVETGLEPELVGSERKPMTAKEKKDEANRRYRDKVKQQKAQEKVEAERRRLAEEGLSCAPVVEDGASEELKAFRHVMVNHPKWDVTEAQRSARKYKEKSYGSFSERLSKMEEDHRSSGRSSSHGHDDGVNRCLQLIAELKAKRGIK